MGSGLVKSKNLVVPGLHLPPDEIFTDGQNAQLLLDLKLSSEFDIVEFKSKSAKLLEHIKGKPKTFDSFDEVHNLFVKESVSHRGLLPANYQHFGNNDNVANLTAFLKSNPFYASALKINKNESDEVYYEIKSVEENSDNGTFFSKCVASLSAAKYARVNMVFDSNLKVTSFTVWKNGAVVENATEEHAHTALLLILSYFAEVVHSCIHVLHYLMVCSLSDSVTHSKVLHTWAKPYFPNIHLTYTEVETLLFAEKGILTGGVFDADRGQILAFAKEVLTIWGSSKTSDEVINRFFLKDALTYGREPLANSNILTQFFAHADLVGPYATELNAEFAKEHGDALTKCNANLAKFGEHTGGVHIDNLATWIEIMSLTGIVHGNTLSMTRLSATPSLIALLNEESTTWDETDVSTITVLLLTICGVVSERHVFSNTIFANDQVNFSPLLRAVLLKYNGLSAALKSDYYAKLSANPDDFAKFGWIYSDYCTDGIDGKQLTITTYI